MMMMISKYANFESYIYYVALGNIHLVISQIMTRLFLGGGYRYHLSKKKNRTTNLPLTVSILLETVIKF